MNLAILIMLYLKVNSAQRSIGAQISMKFLEDDLSLPLLQSNAELPLRSFSY
jgi:hypothetical protein